MTLALFFAFFAAFILGLAKAGLKGLGIVVVAILANIYGAKASTGILLPLLITGDILAVIYYKRFVEWKYLIQFLPAMIVGVLIAVYVGKNLDEKTFKYWMAIIILISVAMLFWRDYMHVKTYPKNPFYAYFMGICAGFTTMIGNLAGSFSNLFFLSTQLPKNQLIATAAWVFFIINIFKVPFHIWNWGTIDLNSFAIDLYLIPAVIMGFFIGLKLVSYFNEEFYRKFLLIATAIGAILIIC